MTFIISSTEDLASISIKKELLNHSTWEEVDTFSQNPVYHHTTMKSVYLITINDYLIHHESIDTEIKNTLRINPKQIIFISRHRSKTGEPTLTTHPIGNYQKAQFGGKDFTLTPSSPLLMTHLLHIIKKKIRNTTLVHHVCFEVTHHGPYLECPALFAEVGSCEKEWIKSEPASVIAQSILEVLTKNYDKKDFSVNIPITPDDAV